MSLFTEHELADFKRDGFVKVTGLVEPSLIDRILEYTDGAVAKHVGPIEYESDLGYPGAPDSRDAPGGDTVRRLLKAFGRDPSFTELASHPQIVTRLRQLLGSELVLPLAHHNCVMVKAPCYGTATGWHQDIRYWRFRQPKLVTMLLALSPATETNGCLKVIPGSHVLTLAEDRLDTAEFLREDHPDNQELIHASVPLTMQAGDVAFFHCRTFHAAGSNQNELARKSVLFTYRSSDNPPIAGTRSSMSPELLLHAEE
ncbi:MAG: phytanoyl-CoA dioxygenase family protein [Candidatus Latescibacteria bacterium]|jgi:phytanoyl-CoA hydroxylase|nr:phytanoyl-CoA dioxygenase family protein [Candidatus Latescibacterota bacterium]